MKLMIVGSGYVGLTTGACLAELGHEIHCIDRDAGKIERLRRGIVPIFEPGLDALIARNAAAGRLHFATSMDGLLDTVDAAFIAVGTPPQAHDASADLSAVFAVAGQIAERATRRLVVVTKSTVPVGTGDRIAAIVKATARVAIGVASNPEFLREGSAIADFMAPDRIVVGANDAAARAVLAAIYAPLTERGTPLLAMPRRAAEIVKYASNCFLATKIAFINEMADLCEAVDADVADVAAGMGLDHRIGAAFLRAGPGFGGSCFPKDCAALLATAHDHRVELAVVSSAMRSNDRRKRALAGRIVEAMARDGGGPVVAVLGLTFKADTDDIREAPPLAIVEGLRKAGKTVRAFDPHGMDAARPRLDGVTLCASAVEACAGADCLVVATEWPEFRALDAATLAGALRGRVIVDLRNLLDPEPLVEAGFVVHRIGRRARRPVARLPRADRAARGSAAAAGHDRILRRVAVRAAE